jgi:hypothetical protein
MDGLISKKQFIQVIIFSIVIILIFTSVFIFLKSYFPPEPLERVYTPPETRLIEGHSYFVNSGNISPTYETIVEAVVEASMMKDEVLESLEDNQEYKTLRLSKMAEDIIKNHGIEVYIQWMEQAIKLDKELSE